MISWLQCCTGDTPSNLDLLLSLLRFRFVDSFITNMLLVSWFISLFRCKFHNSGISRLIIVLVHIIWKVDQIKVKNHDWSTN